MTLEIENKIIKLAKEYKKRVDEVDVFMDNHDHGEGLSSEHWGAIHDRSDAKVALLEKVMELD